MMNWIAARLFRRKSVSFHVIIALGTMILPSISDGMIVNFPPTGGGRPRVSYQFEYRLDSFQKYPVDPEYRMAMLRYQWSGRIAVVQLSPSNAYRGDFAIWIGPEKLQEFLPRSGTRTVPRLMILDRTLPASVVLAKGETYSPYESEGGSYDYRSIAPDGFWIRVIGVTGVGFQSIHMSVHVEKDVQLRMLAKFVANTLLPRLERGRDWGAIPKNESSIEVQHPNGRVMANFRSGKPCVTGSSPNCIPLVDIRSDGFPAWSTSLGASQLFLARRSHLRSSTTDCMGRALACQRIVESTHDSVLYREGSSSIHSVPIVYLGRETVEQGICGLADEITRFETVANVPPEPPLEGPARKFLESRPAVQPVVKVRDSSNIFGDMMTEFREIEGTDLSRHTTSWTDSSSALPVPSEDAKQPTLETSVASQPKSVLTGAEKSILEAYDSAPRTAGNLILVSSYQIRATSEKPATALETDLRKLEAVSFGAGFTTTALCASEESSHFSALSKITHTPSDVAKTLATSTPADGSPSETRFSEEASLISSILGYVESNMNHPKPAKCTDFGARAAWGEAARLDRLWTSRSIAARTELELKRVGDRALAIALMESAMQPKPQSPPAPPTEFKSTSASASSLDLEWIASPSTNSLTQIQYELERCVGVRCNPTRIYEQVPLTNWVVSGKKRTVVAAGLVPNTIYRFRLRARNSSASSPWVFTALLRTSAADGPPIGVPSSSVPPVLGQVPSPTFLRTFPASPAEEPSPLLFGNAASGSTVRIHRRADCSDLPMTTGSAATFLSEGIRVVQEISTRVDYFASATDSLGKLSPCVSLVSYEARALKPRYLLSHPPATVAKLSDGSVIFGGSFERAGGTLSGGVAAFAASNGALEKNFYAGSGFDSPPQFVVALPDGGAILGGTFIEYRGTPCRMLARLTKEGNLHPSFCATEAKSSQSPINQFRGGAYAGSIHGEYIYVAGEFNAYRGHPANAVAKIKLSDGTIDPLFNPVTGANGLKGTASTIVATESALYVGGSFTSYRGQPAAQVARIFLDGTLDTKFNPPQGPNGADTAVDRIVVAGPQEIYLAGQFLKYRGSAVNKIARINSEGELDPGMTAQLGGGAASAVQNRPNALAFDDKFLYVGYNTWPPSVGGLVLARFSRVSGKIDPDFMPTTEKGLTTLNTRYRASISNLYIDEGTIWVSGNFDSWNDTPVSNLVKLDSSGALDKEFASSSRFGANSVTSISRSGTTLWATGGFNFWGGYRAFGIAKFLPSGALDLEFTSQAAQGGFGAQTGPQIYDLLADGTGVFAVGNFESYNGTSIEGMVRLQGNGKLDPIFNPPGRANLRGRLRALARFGDHLYVGGNFYALGAERLPALIRFSVRTGALDNEFKTQLLDAFQTPYVNTVAVDGSGALYVGGQFTSFKGKPAHNLVKLKPSGEIEPDFFDSPPAGNGCSNLVIKVITDADSIFAAGSFGKCQGKDAYAFAKFSSTGQLDSAYNPASGPWSYDSFSDIATDEFSNLYLVGRLTSYRGGKIEGLARLLPDGKLDPDYNMLLSTPTSSRIPAAGVTVIGNEVYVGTTGGVHRGRRFAGVLVLDARTGEAIP